ncbi:contact-dependent growth inhibition system immunity protein [Roseateles sp. UC29_93]|uniref:contact-dependent growth inhibition system immunity protein n=1 Tax=Roseateles sp. UC29_93 TaxID=3350177 RepID=UPI00366B50E2
MPSYTLKGQQQFPDLASFMGGWFHQDFDIEGDSIQDIVGAFRKEATTQLVQLLVADIDRFLETGDDGMDERFQAYFEPDIIPSAFCPTTRDFLLTLRSSLSNSP